MRVESLCEAIDIRYVYFPQYAYGMPVALWRFVLHKKGGESMIFVGIAIVIFVVVFAGVVTQPWILVFGVALVTALFVALKRSPPRIR